MRHIVRNLCWTVMRQCLQIFLCIKNLLYNPASHTYLMAVQVNKDTANSKARTGFILRVMEQVSKI